MRAEKVLEATSPALADVTISATGRLGSVERDRNVYVTAAVV